MLVVRGLSTWLYRPVKDSHYALVERKWYGSHLSALNYAYNRRKLEKCPLCSARDNWAGDIYTESQFQLGQSYISVLTLCRKSVQKNYLGGCHEYP